MKNAIAISNPTISLLDNLTTATLASSNIACLNNQAIEVGKKGKLRVMKAMDTFKKMALMNHAVLICDIRFKAKKASKGGVDYFVFVTPDLKPHFGTAAEASAKEGTILLFQYRKGERFMQFGF